MKETSVDYVLGRFLVLGSQRYRVLEIDPIRGTVRTIREDGQVFGKFNWPEVQRCILASIIEVD